MLKQAATGSPERHAERQSISAGQEFRLWRQFTLHHKVFGKLNPLIGENKKKRIPKIEARAWILRSCSRVELLPPWLISVSFVPWWRGRMRGRHRGRVSRSRRVARRSPRPPCQPLSSGFFRPAVATIRRGDVTLKSERADKTRWKLLRLRETRKRGQVFPVKRCPRQGGVLWRRDVI